MLKDYEIDKPILETDRLIIRKLNENDVADLKEWLGRDEIYTYWGRKANRNEKNPELMFGPDPRPWVKRKPSPDFDWGIVLKESNKSERRSIFVGLIYLPKCSYKIATFFFYSFWIYRIMDIIKHPFISDYI